MEAGCHRKAKQMTLSKILVLAPPRQTLEVQGTLQLATLLHEVPDDSPAHLAALPKVLGSQAFIHFALQPQRAHFKLKTISLKKLSLVSFR